jgi:hypothetical protein
LVIYNHAQVGDETLAQAENKTSEIFARAGTRLVWRDGFAYAAERRKFEIPPPEDPATLVVKLQPASEAARYGVRSVCGGIGFESGAIIFVRMFDATWLGHIMAHELGHILLGSNAHSLVGIMRGRLRPGDWDKAAQGTLGFTPSQNRQIREWIAKRSRSVDDHSHVLDRRDSVKVRLVQLEEISGRLGFTPRRRRLLEGLRAAIKRLGHRSLGGALVKCHCTPSGCAARTLVTWLG